MDDGRIFYLVNINSPLAVSILSDSCAALFYKLYIIYNSCIKHKRNREGNKRYLLRFKNYYYLF